MSKKYKSIPSKRGDPGTRFHKQLILQIVREVEEGLSRKEACDKYGMAYCTLGEWMTRFGSAGYHASKRSHFSIHQRRSIVRALQEGRMTKEEAHLMHKVGKKTLTTWLREALQEDNELVCFNPNDMAVKQIDYSGTELQNELADARLKIKALETMIDIAEEQFKIAIRKKSGAKQ
jgi:transposase